MKHRWHPPPCMGAAAARRGRLGGIVGGIVGGSCSPDGPQALSCVAIFSRQELSLTDTLTSARDRSGCEGCVGGMGGIGGMGESAA
jgi:hypothetical protein